MGANNHSPFRLLITGGAMGFGKALALSWAKAYQKKRQPIVICIADIHEQRALDTIEELKALNADAFYCHCDITSEAAVSALRENVIEQMSGIDCVINNAGVATGGSLKSEAITQWQWVFDINLFGMVRVCQAFVDDFRNQGHGHFINVASQAGLTPIPLMSSYNSVKAAVVSFSETLKLELASDNIDVSVVCPSFFKTHLNESMRTSESMMQETINHLFAKADMTATQVAESVLEQAGQKRFFNFDSQTRKACLLDEKMVADRIVLKKSD